MQLFTTPNSCIEMKTVAVKNDRLLYPFDGEFAHANRIKETATSHAIFKATVPAGVSQWNSGFISSAPKDSPMNVEIISPKVRQIRPITR